MELIIEIVKNRLIIDISGLTCCVLMLLISVMHFYWSLGGKLAVKVSIPHYDGKLLFKPSSGGYFLIGFLSLLGALIALGRAGFLGSSAFDSFYWFGTLVLAAVFLARTIGDFRFVGVFKKVRFSEFAFWDNFVYIPLSFILFACFIILSFS